MNFETFRFLLDKIKQAKSITGKVYNIVSVSSSHVEFIRPHNSGPEKILIKELYNLYSKEQSINTSVAKSYISGRVQSPAVAILNSLNTDIIVPHQLKVGNNATKQAVIIPKNEPIIKINDETKFFLALSELIGKEYLFGKRIGKPVNSALLFLSNNYRDFDFSLPIIDCYNKMLLALKSNTAFTSDSIAHHVDGLIIGHPKLKSRIIEFDEEQHFTPARYETLKYIKEMLPDMDVTGYLNYCCDLNYLNMFVLKKHRIKNRLMEIPKSFIDFIHWLEFSNEKTSGYIEGKNGFEFLGGRIAQRAYYDFLRDTAHLSPKNKILLSPLRFAKKTFEDEGGTDFANLSIQNVKRMLESRLKEIYKLNIH